MTTMTNQGVTDRQLAFTVRFGRKITIRQAESGVEMTGYVAGFDEETIFLAIPTPGGVQKVLVHRDWYTKITLHDESTLSTESPTNRQALTQLLTKFRERILEDYFPDRR